MRNLVPSLLVGLGIFLCQFGAWAQGGAPKVFCTRVGLETQLPLARLIAVEELELNGVVRNVQTGGASRASPEASPSSMR